jgi:hypothetical protein
LNPLSELPHKLGGPGLIVTLSAQIHEHRRNALDFKSRIDGLCLVKAAEQQSSSKQQDHAHGNLRADQQIENKAPALLTCAPVNVPATPEWADKLNQKLPGLTLTVKHLFDESSETGQSRPQ